jgi:hypothetical protein
MWYAQLLSMTAEGAKWLEGTSTASSGWDMLPIWIHTDDDAPQPDTLRHML